MRLIFFFCFSYRKCTDDCPAYYRNTILYSCGGAAIFALLSVFVIQPETAYSNSKFILTPAVVIIIHRTKIKSLRSDALVCCELNFS